MRSSGVLAAALLGLLGAARALATDAPNRWESFGPFPYVQIPLGTVADSALAIAVDPTDPQTIYAGYNAGIYKTIDGGAAWTVVFTDSIGGFPPNARPILGLSLDSGDPSTVFAVTTDSIQRTRNAGITWQPVLVSEGVSAISPALDGAAVFACASNNGSGARASLRSADRGDTWTEMPDLAAKVVKAFAVDSSAPQAVWAAVSEDPAGTAVYRSTDGGATWEPRGSGILSTRIEDLVIDSAAGVLYVATSDAGVFRTSDEGASWQAVSEGLPAAAIEHLAVGAGSAIYASTHLDGIHRSVDGGAHWLPAGFRGSRVASIFADPSSTTFYTGILGGLLRIDFASGLSCENGSKSLCLNEGRFRVEASFRSYVGSGTAHAATLTGDTGYFWFFAPESVEVTLKVLDGSSINGNFWVFYGALSNVEYTITVADTATGAIQSYFNIQGTLTSVADTSAFPASGSPPPPLSSSRREFARPALADACAPGPNALCLNGGRFRVDVAFTRTPLGPTMPAPAVPITSDTGYFWFFDDANVELAVKVLDGRSVNGHFWVFFGALSDVGYSITVTDTATGEQRVYQNPHGTLASVADTSAF